MNILITGNKGFIGSSLEQYLSSKEHTIFGCDKLDGNNVMHISEDYLTENNIDIVIHLAAQTSVWNTNTSLILEDNITSFIHIFDLCKKLDIRFIYASSSCSINVTTTYGLSKQFTDGYAAAYGWDKCVGLRLHNVYGPNSRKDTLCGICLHNDSVKLYNNGNNYRHFTYIDDVCAAIELAFDAKPGLYNVCNVQTNSTYSFCYEISKHKDINIETVSEKRQYDKVSQTVNFNIPSLLTKYTKIQDGIKKIFE